MTVEELIDGLRNRKFSMGEGEIVKARVVTRDNEGRAISYKDVDIHKIQYGELAILILQEKIDAAESVVI